MKALNIEKLEDLITKFSNERDWDQFHSLKNLSMALSVESSELLEIFQWMSEVESNNISQDSEKLSKVKEEVADIFIYLLRIAIKLDIDFEEIVVNKMQENEKKYPVATAKGSSKKYNEY